jgi:hypothetical protein
VRSVRLFKTIFKIEDTEELVMYWQEKGYTAPKRYQKLRACVGRTCSAYSTVTDWIRKLNREEDITQRAFSCECPRRKPPSFSAFALLSHQVPSHISMEVPAFRGLWYSQFPSCSRHALSCSKSANGQDSDRIQKKCWGQLHSEARAIS